MKLAISLLCENPSNRTGLSTFFPALVRESLGLCEGLEWIIYLGPDQEWPLQDKRIELVRDFPANNHPVARLLADHLLVPAHARRRGAKTLLTVGFAPLRLSLPIVMHVLSVHHRSAALGLGYPRIAYRNWAMSRGIRKARLVVTNSQFSASVLQQTYGKIPAERLLVSPEGVDHRSHHPIKQVGEAEQLWQRLGLRPGYVFWASNFYPYKRAELAIDAYARLPVALRETHPLVLVGGDWNGHERAQVAVQRAGIKAQTRFLGWVPDDLMPLLFRHAGCHLLSSSEEGFGRSVLDAMASGCPCVVQDIPALREVADEAALYCDFRDAEQAAALLASCLENPTVYSDLSGQGLKRAALFSWRRVATERLRAICALAGQ